jgi:hypothetical protein
VHPVILQALAGPIKDPAAAADTMQRAHQARRARRRENRGLIRARPAGHRGLVLGTLCLAALILNLDTTIVNVALPALVRQLGATTTGLQ